MYPGTPRAYSGMYAGTSYPHNIIPYCFEKLIVVTVILGYVPSTGTPRAYSGMYAGTHIIYTLRAYCFEELVVVRAILGYVSGYPYRVNTLPRVYTKHTLGMFLPELPPL